MDRNTKLEIASDYNPPYGDIHQTQKRSETFDLGRPKNNTVGPRGTNVETQKGLMKRMFRGQSGSDYGLIALQNAGSVRYQTNLTPKKNE